MKDPAYILRIRIETDDEDKGEFDSIEKARRLAGPDDYLIEVTYQEVRTRIIKYPQPPVLSPEIRKSNWIEMTGERHADDVVYLDLDKMILSPVEFKDPYRHRETIFIHHVDDMPFSSADEIKTMSIHLGKFGVRLSDRKGENTTEWKIFTTEEEAQNFLQEAQKKSESFTVKKPRRNRKKGKD